MAVFIIIDGENINRNNAKRIVANHIMPIPPVVVNQVRSVYPGEVIIDTDRPITIEGCIDLDCKHLIEEIKND